VTLKRDKQLCVTLINKEPDLDAIVTIEPTLSFRKGSVLRLSAPALESKSGVTFGGAMVKSDGSWRAHGEENIRASREKVLLRLPAASAAVLIMKP
jgi:hypothetical protein